MSTPELALWHRAEQEASRDRLDAARGLYQQLARHPDWGVPAQLRLSILAQQQDRLLDAADAILAAAALEQDEGTLAAAVVKQAFGIGEIEAGLRVAAAPVVTGSSEPEVLLDVAQSLCDQSFPDPALPLLEAAAGLGVRSARLFYLIGLARMFAGDLAAAVASYELCLRLQPNDAPAHYMLAGVMRQTPQSNHVQRLRDAVARIGGASHGAPLLYYALFKELDDLGDAEAAWPLLSAGMSARRAQLAYDARADAELFELLQTVGRGADDATEQDPGPCPIFVVGMPRSGTTLLERMLGGHPQVVDAGELRDFTFQARCMTGCPGPLEADGALARALARWTDWSGLGRRYLTHTQWRARGHPFYTDKLPVNYLVLGWIAKALPRAKFLHMVREPMDVCFSNLKQLFAPGNAHSFDPLEMADHYVRYRALMAHWHRAFPGRVLDIDYRMLVTDPQAAARQVLGFCGLPWDPGVVAIETRRGAVATASMVQVREAIHTRFLGQWQRYATPLEPMRARLAAAGL
ncbi:MAG: sulfotransferase [Rubrivivax sp.]|nr:sulfotransferase [Rubrivivax sp.]